jgi:uncharacterized protein YbjQ (UPF0145 family)
MKIATTDFFPGDEISEFLGLVSGSTIRSKNLFRDIGAGLKSLIGGELRGYSEMMNEAREEAIARMKEEAEKLGADGVVATRLQTSTLAAGAAEVIAYGTAVRLSFSKK